MSVAIGQDFAWVHDSELTSVTMDRLANTLELRFRSVDGLTYALLFEDATEYRIEDVRFQNVVFRFLIYGHGAAPEDERLDRLLRWTLNRATSGGVESVRGAIRHGSRLLFYAEPSVGAEIGVVARAIRVSPDQSTR